MKKALLCGLSVVMLLALVLVACNKPQADQPTEPDPLPTPSAVQTQPAETPEPEETSKPEETNKPINQVEQMSANATQQEEVDTRRLATDAELLKVFRDVYEFGQSCNSTGDTLALELNQLHWAMKMMANFKAPDDLDDQYIAWRATQQGQGQAQQQQQTTNTAGNSTTTTTQAGTPATGGTGDSGTVQPISGDLGTDVTGGISPNDFLNRELTEEEKASQKYIEEHAYLDWSKVVMGD